MERSIAIKCSEHIQLNTLKEVTQALVLNYLKRRNVYVIISIYFFFVCWIPGRLAFVLTKANGDPNKKQKFQIYVSIELD